MPPYSGDVWKPCSTPCHAPGATIQADASYYGPPPPADDAPKADAAAVASPAAENDLRTKLWSRPTRSRLCHLRRARPRRPLPPLPSPRPIFPKTVATVSLPPQTNAAADDTKSTGHFVHVSREELGKDEIEEAKPAIISLQTWSLAAGLLLVGFGVWYFLQPPKPESLYRRIAARTENEKIESIMQAEDDIRQFLEVYPDDRRGVKASKISSAKSNSTGCSAGSICSIEAWPPPTTSCPSNARISKPWATST